MCVCRLASLVRACFIVQRNCGRTEPEPYMHIFYVLWEFWGFMFPTPFREVLG